MSNGKLSAGIVAVVWSLGSTTAVSAQSQVQETEIHREHAGPSGAVVSPASLLAPINTAMLEMGPFFTTQVNVDDNGANIPNDAANEPSLARDPFVPERLSIGWRQFDSVRSGFRQAGWSFSQDGGHSWTFPGSLTPGVFRSDPVLAVDGDGRFYYYSLSNGFCCQFFTSDDGGMTWSDPVEGFGGDKQWFTIDRTDGIGRGHIYAVWNQSFPCTGGAFTRSTDGGRSFSDPVLLPGAPFWGTVAVGPDGVVYIASANHNFVRSTNAKDPDQAPEFEIASRVEFGGPIVRNGAPNPGGILGQVWTVADHSDGDTRGNVYVLASVAARPMDPADMVIARSGDGGLTWDTPVIINDDAPDRFSYQWFGSISVAPTGRIDVTWYDTRNALDFRISELHYAWSIDGGATWSRNVKAGPAFDSHVGWPTQNKLGDYNDQVSDELGAHLAFATTYNNEQDVFYTHTAVDCDKNNLHDGDDIAAGRSTDKNGDLIPDQCQANCRGREDIARATCRTRRDDRRVVVKLRGGTPRDTIDVMLGGDALQRGELDGRGRARIVFGGQPDGRNTVMARWGCGGAARRDYACE